MIYEWLLGQRCKDGGGDLLYYIQEFAVEFRDRSLGVCQVGSGFPGVVSGVVFLSLN